MQHLRNTARLITAQATHIRIDDARLSVLADELKQLPIPAWDTEWHGSGDISQLRIYALMLDAINFCFWPADFVVVRDGKTFGIEDGYAAIATGLRGALEKNSDFAAAERLAQMSAPELVSALDIRGTLPLADERARNLRELGRMLLLKYNGDADAFFAHGKSAEQLATKLAGECTAFRDERTYKGISFHPLKRAQICIGDIAGATGHIGKNTLTDLHALTAFADYKLPQLFHSRGVFVYDSALERRILNKEELPENSEEEVEIRAATIDTVEKLRTLLRRKGRDLAAYQIDWILWNMSIVPGAVTTPHHRTITTSY